MYRTYFPAGRGRRLACAAACVALLVSAAARGEDIRYPDDAGIINARDFGVKGDGRTDDTAALNALLAKHSGVKSWAHDRSTIYLPNGVYLVSDQLLSGALVSIQGQSRAGTIIRLKDGSAGFGNAARPRAVLTMARENPRNNYNMVFGSYVLNLTVETGCGNAGAAGIAMCSHNTGGLQMVTIRCGSSAASQPAGEEGAAIGLDMRQPVQGPALCRDVSIEGPFDYAIRMDPSVTASTFENISISQPRKGGIAIVKHPAAVRLLKYNGTAPAVVELESDCEGGHLVLIDSVLSGGQKDSVAIDLRANKSDSDDGDTAVLLRNVRVEGFGIGVKNSDGSTVPPETLAGEWHTGKAVSAWDADHSIKAPATLNLPIKEVPPMPWEEPARWANVRKFGAVLVTASNRKPTDKQDGKFFDELGEVYDITAALPAAIASGASTVYLPKGLYVLRKPVTLGGKLRILQACRSVIFPDPAAEELKGGQPMLILEGAGQDVVWVDQLSAAFKQSCGRTLVITRGGGSYVDGPGAGDLFMDDICMAPIELTARHNAWIRQCDTEADGPKLVNTAATVWVLGIKTEGIGRDVYTGSGAATEILGGLFYPGMRPTRGFSIEVEDGRLSASLARFWDRQDFYKETRDGRSRTLATPKGHRQVHLLTSH